MNKFQKVITVDKDGEIHEAFIPSGMKYGANPCARKYTGKVYLPYQGRVEQPEKAVQKKRKKTPVIN